MNFEDEYLKTRAELDKLINEREGDPTIARVDREIARLNSERDEIIQAYTEKISPIEKKLGEIQQAFLGLYDGQKTLILNKLTLSFRETRSLRVIDSNAIVDTLIKIGQVSKGVKSFALKHLRTLADAEVLPAGSYEWDVKTSVIVSKVER